jgi:hypothetical protein
MKFGKLLDQAARPDWAINYVNYKVPLACNLNLLHHFGILSTFPDGLKFA